MLLRRKLNEIETTQEMPCANGRPPLSRATTTSHGIPVDMALCKPAQQEIANGKAEQTLGWRDRPPLLIKKTMKLKGLSHYDIRFTEDDRVRVYSLFYNRYLSPIRRDAMDKWCLKTDDGKSRHITEGQLRFMRNHPEVSAEGVSMRATGIKFRKDGTVANLYGGERGRSYALFTSSQDALNTVLFLISAHDGNKSPLLRFIEQSRWNAITTVAKLLGCAVSTVAPHFETAAARFLRETEEFNVERILPIFSWLCKCLRCTVREQRSLRIKISDNMERFGDSRPDKCN